MSDIHWTNYVGMFTGIFGAIMGFIGYKKSNKIKSLDMRMELREDINNARLSLAQLEELLPYADKSRRRVAAAAGNSGSGRMQLWEQEFVADTERLMQIAGEIPNPEIQYSDLRPEGLEQEIIDIHQLQGQLDLLSKKYKSTVQEDDQMREEIRKNH